jgi:hypothetical protein
MPPPTIDPCAEAKANSDEALEDFRDAWEDLDQAQEALDDAESFWDDNTWGSTAAVAGVAIVCSTNPIGWTACGLGAFVGGVSYVGSEIDRQGDIEAAENALARARRDYAKANRRFQKAMRKEAHCRLHHKVTGQPA